MRDAGINTPEGPYIDLFWMPGSKSNQQLAIMWERILRIYPAWIMSPLSRVNRLLPGGVAHEVGVNISHMSRDIYNLLDKSPPHIHFTAQEISRGEKALKRMGITKPFVCLLVRDNAYLNATSPSNMDYHNYRDCNIQNYVLVAEELANRGYFVIRMGELVNESIKSKNPSVIDYATDGMRSEFLDVYLAAKCEFTITTGAGWDSLPNIFRRPIVYTNLVPFGNLITFCEQDLNLAKTHLYKSNNQEHKLSISEIYEKGIAYYTSSNEYSKNNVVLIENTPEEIRDIAIEMSERLNRTWTPHEEDEAIQSCFWSLFDENAIDSDGVSLHGEIRAKYGTNYLRENQWWLK